MGARRAQEERNAVECAASSSANPRQERGGASSAEACRGGGKSHLLMRFLEEKCSGIGSSDRRGERRSRGVDRCVWW